MSKQAIAKKPKNLFSNLPPPTTDLPLREEITFDWRRNIIYRNCQFGVAKSIEIPMIDEYHCWSIAGGVTVLDVNGNKIINPIQYNHNPVARVTFGDLFGIDVKWGFCRVIAG